MIALCHLEGRLFAPVLREVLRQAPGLRTLTQPQGDEGAYCQDLLELWLRGGDLLIVEGDVLPPAGAIAGLLACPRPWCAHAVWTGQRYDPYTLGLVRFAAEVTYQQQYALAAWTYGGERGRPRSILEGPDARIANRLRWAGFQLHVHAPPAVHLRYPSDPGLSSRLPGYRPREPAGVVDVRRPG